MFTYPSLKQTALFLCILGVVIIVDFVTKEWALSTLFVPEISIMVTSFFHFTPVWNPGISFGLFSDSPVTGYVIPALAVFVVIWLYIQLATLTPLQRICAGLIAGGAIGNVIDRLRFGKVVDFLDFHLYGYHWPAFNIADAAISIGVALWICSTLYAFKQQKRQN